MASQRRAAPRRQDDGGGAAPARRRVLVAGGAGFLGGHLCALLLRQGHEVIALDSLQTGLMANLAPLLEHPRFRFIHHDICDRLHDAPSVDQVFNLACPASPPQYQADPVHTMLTNVLGTHNLLELAAGCGARFLQASTSEVYGDPEQHPQTEAYRGHVSPTGPRACYDEGKRAAETLCFDMLRLGRVDARVVRIFNTYGPRMRADDGRIVSNFICQALAGEPLTIYGSGTQTRSFCFVSDLIRGMAALMALPDNPREPVNLGNPGERSIAEIAELVRSMTNSASRIVHRPLPVDDPRRRCPDIGRARALLGWQPEVALEDGLRPTIAWFAGAGAPKRLPAAAAP
ncbi:UDP-glucuronic acid decarboxylase family protein [Falsiroseomonas selenitidurans]|uniref:SDR family oxidoreductase n=1 Tax=Falsiroseomonas selenitidurans TaxID=2716335 RepID=A0ABX1E074_9PROT|nr:UDP-glucuronic acid decarboxylase family protein [Falsiroseomonas selenitidurans]NKC30541.1 SDR family oxidoreductase [Falsiroseomonas selenitidurans]